MATRVLALLKERLADADVLLALEPEQLAEVVFAVLRELEGREDHDMQRGIFIGGHLVQVYPREKLQDVQRAIAEAWIWLETEGLIGPVAESNLVFITRRGRRIRNDQDWTRFRASRVLPRQQLHPRIEPKVWSPFLTGNYDTAVFEAFKAVEVAVRTAGGYDAGDITNKLMNKAFGPGGTLEDANLEGGEREGLRQLFAGAMLFYRNAAGHRYIHFDDVAEAAEAILLANQLMRIVERIAQVNGLPF